MRAKRLSGLLKKNDRVAVSNITGREAGKVSIVSQRYSGNIVGGWALGKGGQEIEVPGAANIPVFSCCEELCSKLPKSRQPNKVIIYSPPEAVYGEVKEVIAAAGKSLQTIFVITENVSIEVTAKIHQLCVEAKVDVLGCNTLGVINTHDHVRIGAIGGDAPEESFVPGSTTIISNSGNMTNTIAGYMLTAGLGTHFAISTGKDLLILTPLRDLLTLVDKNDKTRLIVLYVEPGGCYEEDAVAWMRQNRFDKPVLVYVAGKLMEGRKISLGHAGAVVEGRRTSASGKMALFDEYFGIEPFDPDRQYHRNGDLAPRLRRGMRVRALHHLPAAARLIYETMGWKRDFPVRHELRLNPWLVDFGRLAEKLPGRLNLKPGTIPDPYHRHLSRQIKESVGLIPSRRNMRNASHASSLNRDGQHIYGYNLSRIMQTRSFGEALVLDWTGELPRYEFEARLVEMCLIASLTNGPGTISAQGAKLSASAGNAPHMGMIGTLAAIGDVHGGNGRQGVRYLMKIFGREKLSDPYAADCGIDISGLARKVARKFKRMKDEAKNTGVDYPRIPCLGHPIFNDKPVNLDPREQVIAAHIKAAGKRNVFLDFWHELAGSLQQAGVSSRVWAVNMDAALAAVWLGICWQALLEKRITLSRVENCAFLGFALGRAAGGAGEFLDHHDFGTPMDMRVPRDDCQTLNRVRELP